MKTAFQLKSYIRFLWSSSNQHGVHSPFVFNLVTRCFYNKNYKKDYAILKKRKLLSESYNALITSNDTRPLFHITRYLEPKSIVSIGIQSEWIDIAFKLGNAKTNTINTLFEKHESELLDLAYFNSTDTSQLSIFESLLPTTHNESFFIFNGIHKTPLTEQNWKRIKNHQKVTISIDTYHLGFIFFRKEQAKEHFIIRI